MTGNVLSRFFLFLGLGFFIIGAYQYNIERTERSKAVYTFGYKCALDNLPHTLNPYEGHLKIEWAKGWIQGTAFRRAEGPGMDEKGLIDYKDYWDE